MMRLSDASQDFDFNLLDAAHDVEKIAMQSAPAEVRWEYVAQQALAPVRDRVEIALQSMANVGPGETVGQDVVMRIAAAGTYLRRIKQEPHYASVHAEADALRERIMAAMAAMGE